MTINIDDEIIPIGVMELRACLMMCAAACSLIVAEANAEKRDAKYHRKLVEAEIEKIIKMTRERKR